MAQNKLADNQYFTSCYSINTFLETKFMNFKILYSSKENEQISGAKVCIINFAGVYVATNETQTKTIFEYPYQGLFKQILVLLYQYILCQNILLRLVCVPLIKQIRIIIENRSFYLHLYLWQSILLNYKYVHNLELLYIFSIDYFI
ncbi:unnamed protein product [Paramecium octaurelia]|uniref:Uncharacterized protein n=1 Tax=Paramecium octaurelia TaxID=43137 RepID=A0A8S1XM97_PAROT|nr:unnamed protein product [Paramecium octaurelia]